MFLLLSCVKLYELVIVPTYMLCCFLNIRVEYLVYCFSVSELIILDAPLYNNNNCLSFCILMACLSLFSFNGLSCLSLSGYFSWQSFRALNDYLIENPPSIVSVLLLFSFLPLLFDQSLPFSYGLHSVDLDFSLFDRLSLILLSV